MSAAAEPSAGFDWNAAAKEVRDLCGSSGWEVNQTQAELAVAALCDRFATDAERAVLDAAGAWADADAIASRQPYGTGRNVWRKTAERLAVDVFVAARIRHAATPSSRPS